MTAIAHAQKPPPRVGDDRRQFRNIGTGRVLIKQWQLELDSKETMKETMMQVIQDW
jgi:hypothetical protein